jgi:hypothetical protein
MSQTAYVTKDGSQRVYVVDYEIGPVFMDLADIKLSWYRNSFRPQPIGATWSSINVQIGEGQSGQYDGGSYAVNSGSAATAAVIAVPDEMQTSPVPPRTLQHDKTFMVFYGAAATGIAATGGTNLFTVATGHGLRNGQLVTLTTSNTLPSGLTTETLYYIVSRAATTVSFALTPGGSAISHSGAGTGTHAVVPFKISGFFAMADNPEMSNNRPLGLL